MRRTALGVVIYVSLSANVLELYTERPTIRSCLQNVRVEAWPLIGVCGPSAESAPWRVKWASWMTSRKTAYEPTPCAVMVAGEMLPVGLRAMNFGLFVVGESTRTSTMEVTCHSGWAFESWGVPLDDVARVDGVQSTTSSGDVSLGCQCSAVPAGSGLRVCQLRSTHVHKTKFHALPER